MANENESGQKVVEAIQVALGTVAAQLVEKVESQERTVFEDRVETRRNGDKIEAVNVSDGLITVHGVVFPKGSAFAWSTEDRAVTVDGRAMLGPETKGITLEPIEGIDRAAVMQDGKPVTAGDMLNAVISEAIANTIAEVVADAKSSGEPLEELPKQITGKINQYYSPCTKLANSIRSGNTGELFGKKEDLEKPLKEVGEKFRVAGQNEIRRGKDVSIYALVVMREDPNKSDALEISTKLTGFDLQVHDAVSSFVEQYGAPCVITGRQINDALTGMPTKASAARLREIEESLDKMRYARVKVDYSEQVRGRVLKDGDMIRSTKVEGAVIPHNKTTATTANGRTAQAYEILSMPPMYKYAKTIKQIVPYPVSMLAADCGTQITTPIIIMKHRVASMIQRMKNPRGNTPHVIVYDTLLRDMGAADADRKTQNRYKNAVCHYLKSLREDGEIKGFREFTEGSSKRRSKVEIRL